MNPLVAKEIRLVLPAYGIALLSAIVPVWLLPGEPNSLFNPFTAFCFGASVLALSSFGREFSLMTFPLLMAQPVNRARIWRIKLAVLGAALTTVLIAWHLSYSLRPHAANGSPAWHLLLGISAMAVVLFFVGGLWSTLLLRQVTAAFWFTFLIPGAILGILKLKDVSDMWIFLSLGLYSVVGFWWARHLFFRAQETAWTGGVISLPGRRRGDTASGGAIRQRRPLAALFWKELQLHQVALAGIAGLFLLHLLIVALRKVGVHSFSESVRGGLQVFAGLWFVVPLLVACPSVAEERKLGTMQGHLCLPISSGKQFTIKFIMVLLVGGLLSSVLLWTAESISNAIGAGSDIVRIVRTDIENSPAFGWVSLIFFVVSLIGFFASTVARHLVQSFGLAVATAVAAGVLIAFASRPIVFGFWLWSGPLVNFLVWPTLTLTLIWLAWRNFKSDSETLWRRNILGLLTSLLFSAGLTSSLYHRVWELLTPLEAVHGPARIDPGRPTVLKSYFGDGVTLLLPDGRLCMSQIAYDRRWRDLSVMAPGSNWVDAVSSFYQTIGIRSDGTLWISEKPRQPGIWSNSDKDRQVAEAAGNLVRFGRETNWQNVAWDPAPPGRSIILLKRDGTLWRWISRTNIVLTPESKSIGLRAFEPQRLGTESDWARILAGPGELGRVYVWQADGKAWALHYATRLQGPAKSEATQIELEPGLVLERWPAFDNVQWRSLAFCLGGESGVRSDGTLWAWNILPSGIRAGEGAQAPLTQIGKDADWESVAGNYARLTGLKRDGSLWDVHIAIAYSPNGARAMLAQLNQPPIRLGINHDWIAAGSAFGGTVSLAADGSFWYWWDRTQPWNSDQAMLAPSRRPVKIENILAHQR